MGSRELEEEEVCIVEKGERVVCWGRASNREVGMWLGRRREDEDEDEDDLGEDAFSGGYARGGETRTAFFE